MVGGLPGERCSDDVVGGVEGCNDGGPRLEVRLDQDELDKELMVQETEDLKVQVEGLERQLAES